MKKLGKWVDSGERAQRSPEAAIELLHSRPAPGGLVQVPLRYVPREGYQQAIGNQEINDRIDRAPIQDVPLDSLVAIQHTVNRARVEEYIRNPKLVRKGTKHDDHGGIVDKPIVVRCKGTNYLFDGHHRVSAAKFSAARTVKARMVDLDADPPKDPPGR